jgi:hypothetical protein
MEGPFADINADYASVWVALDSYGRVHHVTGDLVEAERLLLKIQRTFEDALHALNFPFRPGEVYVDGLPGGRNRMVVSFTVGAMGGRWNDETQDKVTTALKGFGIRGYKPLPK